MPIAGYFEIFITSRKWLQTPSGQAPSFTHLKDTIIQKYLKFTTLKTGNSAEIGFTVSEMIKSNYAMYFVCDIAWVKS